MLRRAPGKPACDQEDRAAREKLVDALVRDAYRAHDALRGERLDGRVAEAAAVLVIVAGQEIEETDDGRFQTFAEARDRSRVDLAGRSGALGLTPVLDCARQHPAIEVESTLAGPKFKDSGAGMRSQTAVRGDALEQFQLRGPA